MNTQFKLVLIIALILILNGLFYWYIKTKLTKTKNANLLVFKIILFYLFIILWYFLSQNQIFSNFTNLIFDYFGNNLTFFSSTLIVLLVISLVSLLSLNFKVKNLERQIFNLDKSQSLHKNHERYKKRKKLAYRSDEDRQY